MIHSFFLYNCSIFSAGACKWVLEGHTAPVTRLRLDASGGSFLSTDSSGRDRSIRLWNLTNGQLILYTNQELGYSTRLLLFPFYYSSMPTNTLPPTNTPVSFPLEIESTVNPPALSPSFHTPHNYKLPSGNTTPALSTFFRTLLISNSYPKITQHYGR